MGLGHNFKAIFFIIKNLIIVPCIRILLFVCISIQTVIAFWGFYNITKQHTWSDIHDTTENISNYFTKGVECIASLVLISTIIVHTKTFLGAPLKQHFAFFSNVGFRSVWLGIGAFYIIVANTRDDPAIALIKENAESMATNIDSLQHQVKFVYWSRYITFTAGTLYIIFSILMKFGSKLPCVGDYFKTKDPDEDTGAKPTKWTRVKSKVNKLLLLIFYFIILVVPIFVIVLNILYLYLEFKDYKVGTVQTSEQASTVVHDVVGNRLMNGVPDLLLSLVILKGFARHFWLKPYKPIQGAYILLYVYLLCTVHAHAKKYAGFMKEDGWNASETNFRNFTLGLLIAFIGLPVLFWIAFITLRKHEEEDAVTASGTNTDGNLTLFKSAVMRIVDPIKVLFSKYIFKPIKWYKLIYTLAILTGLAGGVMTTLSQNYQKFYIDFQALDTLQAIDADFQTIHNKITDVSNGFIIIAANLNPCLSYEKSSGGPTLSNLISSQATTKGNDGHSGVNPSTTETMLQQLYDNSNDKDFQQNCFKTTDGKLVWSGSTTSQCKEVQNLDDSYSMKDLKEKESKNTGTPPDCSTAEKCQANSNLMVASEYTLKSNEECETGACTVFIAGLWAAFAASFIPFGGPAISKGAQIALRLAKGVKQFGKVFKRVASQVRSKRDKIKSMYEVFSKILGGASLTVKNNYQFFYFLAPTIVLAIIAFAIGLYRRRKATTASRSVFVAFFLVMAGVCGTFTFLSFKFTDLLSELIQKPFENFSTVSIKTAVGMDMIKWGYLLSTASSLLFLVSALYSYISYYVFGKAYLADENIADEMELQETTHKFKNKQKLQRKYSSPKRQANKFSAFLVAFLVTLPVYYFVYTAHTDQVKIVNVKLEPSAGLEEVRVTFGHTNALEREFGSINDLDNDNNENLCDIVANLIRDVIDNLKLPLPAINGESISSIKDLFNANFGIRANVAAVIERVRAATELNISGFNLFEGVDFVSIDLSFANWQMLLVFGLPMFLVVGIAICLVFTFIQQLGFLQENKIMGQMLMPFFERMIVPVAIASFFNQLAVIGIFSFMDGFETPMFTLSMGVGKMVTYGLVCSVICLIASVLQILTEYAPIADDSIQDLNEEE